MRAKRATFTGVALPLAFLLPQLAITAVFFLWPAWQALVTSLYQEDPFGLSSRFAGLLNFERLFADPLYLNSLVLTLVFSFAVAVLAIVPALVLAFMADHVIRGARLYRTLLVWPYAIAPAVAGVLWWFLFNPSIGVVAYVLRRLGYAWDHHIHGGDALALVVIASAYKQISYNFLFFLAGLQAVPRSLHEAAALDGAGPVRRFVAVSLPLLMPTTFFLLVVDLIYAFFDTFGVVAATTRGGPGQDTTILVYKVFRDGFEAQDFGGSAAQSVILMLIVMGLTVLQFRFIERRIAY